MTNDFSKMVANSNLAHWMETLAILATYSAREYQALCEQLAERLEKEKFDIRSALICYICAKNFPKTVSIWAITHVASQGSQNLALQDLVEKMAVLQDVTKFQQSDALFSQKLTKYAEILANSGRLTAAMRYLCLLPDDNSSATLRDRIFNSAPAQMGQMLRSAPRFPFQTTDVRASAVVPQAPKMPATGAKAAPVPGKAPGAQMAGQMPGPGGAWPMQPKSMPHSGMGPGPGPMPGQPGPGVGVGPGGMAPGPMPHMGPCPGQPGPCPGACGPQGPGPCPGGCGGCGPNPCGPNPCNPNMGVPGPGVGPIPGGGGGMGCGGPIPGGCGGCGGMGPGPVPGGVPGPGGPVPGGGWPAKPAAPAAPVPPGKSTAPTASAMPVTEGMPVAWPLPTKAMQKLSTNQSVADANMAIQEMSSGGSAVIGEPLPPHDLAHVKNVFTLLLDSSQDNNPKKREDVLKKLEELYTKLQTGQLKTATSQKVLQLAKAMEAQDYATAQKVQQELSVDWDTNKSWLMGVKRLITTRSERMQNREQTYTQSDETLVVVGPANPSAVSTLFFLPVSPSSSIVMASEEEEEDYDDEDFEEEEFPDDFEEDTKGNFFFRSCDDSLESDLVDAEESQEYADSENAEGQAVGDPSEEEAQRELEDSEGAHSQSVDPATTGDLVDAEESQEYADSENAEGQAVGDLAEDAEEDQEVQQEPEDNEMEHREAADSDTMIGQQQEVTQEPGDIDIHAEEVGAATISGDLPAEANEEEPEQQGPGDAPEEATRQELHEHESADVQAGAETMRGLDPGEDCAPERKGAFCFAQAKSLT
ncbi:sec31 [Symbiodinium sp. KB8]|nr:sec31 [Symbiodinium sp. KB8]